MTGEAGTGGAAEREETAMKLVLEEGRPADVTGRLEKEIRCYDMLDRLKIRYWRTDHPEAHADTMEACREIDAVLQAKVTKNLLLCNRQQTNFYILMMPGDKVFKTKELSHQINSARLSFASPDYMLKFLDITPGSLSVLGLMNDKENHVRLLVDREIAEAEYIGVHPCINTSSLKVATKDIFGPFLKEVHHDMTIVDLKGEE